MKVSRHDFRLCAKNANPLNLVKNSQRLASAGLFCFRPCPSLHTSNLAIRGRGRFSTTNSRISGVLIVIN
nr:MAG TPA_asm: hypothetical protein [Caudoviricetes sp.]